jgi:acetyl-CoA carboxylase carboxyltransferase component
MSRERLRWLESQLNRDNLTDEEFELYNKEANTIQAEINSINKEKERQRREREAEEKQERALEYVKSLTDEDVDRLYIEAHNKYAGDINGMPFDEWFKQAQKYYTIDANFVVHSTARSSKQEYIDSVQCVSEAHARYRVLQLILFKLRDHGERGHDFRWID